MSLFGDRGLKEQIDELTKELEAARQRIHGLELELAGVRIECDDLRRRAPEAELVEKARARLTALRKPRPRERALAPQRGRPDPDWICLGDASSDDEQPFGAFLVLAITLPFLVQ